MSVQRGYSPDGADGARLKKIESDPVNGTSVTLYMGPVEIRKYGQGAAEEILLYPRPDIRITRTRSGSTVTTKVFALHADGLGSVRAVTDEAGAAVERTAYRPFGEEVALALPLALPETKGFIGERYDEAAGLQYLNARYYDPRLGMFLQPDWWEVTEPGVGTNRYSYAFNDPVNGRDPGGNAMPPPPDDQRDDRETSAGSTSSGPTSRPNNGGSISVDNHETASCGPPRRGGTRGSNGGRPTVGVSSNGPATVHNGGGGSSNGREMTIGTGRDYGVTRAGGPEVPDEFFERLTEGGGGRGGAGDGNIWSNFGDFGTRSEVLEDPIQKHHSWPQFLGGPRRQELTPMPRSTHGQFHNDLNAHLGNVRNGSGRSMAPSKANPGAKIREMFSESQRLSALRDFYRGPGSRYVDAARDFFRQFGGE